MATVTKEVFVHVSVGDVAEQPMYIYLPCDMSQHGYVLVAKTVCTFEAPGAKENIPKHVAAMEERIRKVNLTAYEETQELRGQINNLLALEFDTEVAP